MSSKSAQSENEETSETIEDVSAVNPAHPYQDEMAELRRILIKSDEISDVLPHAIIKSSKKDYKLADATMPLTEENIRQSVKQNPNIIAEAIFPAIGPAIKKAIAEALGQMVQSLNQTLEYSVSPKGMRWRLEAWQAGKPFAEVVMLKTLLYRVEEVFLIHRETGILLQHVSADNKDLSQDADMVSAMLTAIQDFVNDSFKDAENATLDSLKLNDLSVWIEHSPETVLAVVIRGNSPLSLRETLREAVQEIQSRQQNELDDFEGDTDQFQKSRPILQRCLQYQLSSENSGHKYFSPVRIVSYIGLGILAIIGIYYIQDYLRWNSYLSRLADEPGIVVTESDQGWFRNSVSGLRDPLAANPVEILKEYHFDSAKTYSNWKPYQDLSPAIIQQRAYKILKPPEGVTLTFENGILSADGTISDEWFFKAKQLSATMEGVSDFRLRQYAIKSKIDETPLFFNCGTVDFAENQDEKIASIQKDLEKLFSLEKAWKVEIIGQADSTGSEVSNLEISKRRAEKVLDELLKSSVLKQNQARLSVTGVSTGMDAECKVTFQVDSELK